MSLFRGIDKKFASRWIVSVVTLRDLQKTVSVFVFHTSIVIQLHRAQALT